MTTPLKRRLRIHGVPVLGGRDQLAEVAASTGAGVLVIAIAGRSGRLIRDLTEAAERCGLVPKVIPSIRELLTGGARIEGVRDPRISDLLGRPRGDDRRGRGARAHRGQARPGDRGRRIHRRRALPPAAPARARPS